LVGGKRFKDLLSAAGRIIHATRHTPLLQTGGAAGAITLELIRADGSRFPVLVTSLTKGGTSELPAYIRTTVFDATAYIRYEQGLVEARERAERAEAEARRALAAAQAASRGKAHFLAAMNHEFRTPIGIIAGFSELLLGNALAGRGTPEQAGYIKEIDAAAHHLLGMLEDATRYAGLDDLARNLDRRPADPNRLAAAGLRLARVTLEQAGVTALQAAPGEETGLSVDPASIAEAVACVLREVARRVPRGSVLEVACRTMLGAVTIEIRCGVLNLTEAGLNDLLAPLDTSEVYTRGLEGSGLGIAVAHRILQIHGGKLRIGREQDGAAAFVLEMPKSD
jgi:signal transduction histidine kinase